MNENLLAFVWNACQRFLGVPEPHQPQNDNKTADVFRVSKYIYILKSHKEMSL